MSFTTDLAPELVLRILHFVDPPALVDLACSCKFLDKCSSDLLKKHRALHAQYRVYNDGNPQSITKVLRNALRDTDIAWHIRELGFYRIRTQWSHWAVSKVEQAENAGMELVDSSLQPDYAFTQDEQTDLLDQLREVYHFDERAIDKAREDLQHGNDAPLKLLLIGACPRIRCVKFSRDLRITGKSTLEDGSLNSDTTRSGLEYLHQAIINQRRSRSVAWPAGLNSLQDLALGVDTEFQPNNSTFTPSALLFANCMHLPNLVSLYCFGLQIRNADVDDQDAAGARYEIEKRSSSVQHMFLEGINGYHFPMEGVLRGCKQLKSLTIHGGEVWDVDAIVEWAGQCYQKSLETLMFYETERLSGYRSSLFRPEYLEGLVALRTLYVDAGDVMLDAFYKYDGGIECGRGNMWISDVQFFIKFWMDRAFPESMEVLVLGTHTGRSCLFDGDANLLDQAITTMIEYGRDAGRDGGEGSAADNSTKQAANFERSFPNLKAVYLRDLDNLKFNIDQPRRKRWFPNAITAGRKFGVDVHTRTTRGRPFHQVDFPKRPMMTSHYFDEEVVFDVYKGKWLRPKCGNCGTCEWCLRQYDAGVWKEVEDELEGECS